MRFNRPVTEKRKEYLKIAEIDCVDFRYAAEGSDLLIHALYLVVPGLSDSEEVVKPIEGEYLLDPRATELDKDRIAILYGQDEQGIYGNLLVVDFHAKTVIPDLPSVIAR